MSLCQDCKKTFCRDHYEGHECDRAHLVNPKAHAFVADWQVQAGEMFHLLDPTSVNASYYRPAVKENRFPLQPSSSSATGSKEASAKKMPAKRSTSRPPMNIKPVVPKFAEPTCPPPTRPVEEAETPKRVRSLTAEVDTSGNAEGDKRQRNMERETAVRSKSVHSDDVTPHLNL